VWFGCGIETAWGVISPLTTLGLNTGFVDGYKILVFNFALLSLPLDQLDARRYVLDPPLRRHNQELVSI
jgi:hypothetical protein